MVPIGEWQQHRKESVKDRREKNGPVWTAEGK